jgi:hypothetical protein
MNGWTKEQVYLMAQWSDVASCYRWLHDRAEKKYSKLNMSITIPVIILSTLTGAANFAVGSFIPPYAVDVKNYVGAGLGALSIGAGIMTTLGNFFQFAQKSESNRVAGIAWGKFQRLVSVELAIHPDNRIEAMDFLGICRQDLDRLIEQSPPITDDIIKQFEEEFKEIPNLKVPDICHGIEHTRVFDSSKARLAQVAADAMIHLRHKKGILAKAVVPELEKQINEQLSSRIEARIKELLPSTPSPPAEKGGDTSTRIVGLEKNWRRLLTTRRNILETTVINSDVKGILEQTRPGDIRINIVGTDGSLPKTPASRPASAITGASAKSRLPFVPSRPHSVSASVISRAESVRSSTPMLGAPAAAVQDGTINLDAP